MPTYDYECECCGPFTAMQPMARFKEPRPCPGCGAAAPRAMFSPPAILGIDPAGRVAYQPIRSCDTGQRPAAAPHPAGCGCCMRRPPLPAALSAGGRVFTAHGPTRRTQP